MKAIVIGATGLVGSNLVEILNADNAFAEVLLLTRRETGLTSTKVKEKIVNFDKPETYKEFITGDVLFSCMGTTIKTAGSKAAQYKVDYTYQFETAQTAAENGVKKYCLVSASGANAKSLIFYSRIKGELDEAVKKLGFENTYIFRPSVLVGKRKEERKAEEVSYKVISFLQKIIPPLKKYRGIKGSEVAQAMVNVSKSNSAKAGEVYTLDEIFDLL